MRYLLFSIALVLASCSSEYKSMKASPVDLSCAKKVMPTGLSTSWYDASVDILDKHISGLLLIKVMPDSTTRLVFTNEGGVTYFDMAFDTAGQFKVHYMMKQLNRKQVVQTLKTDFELMLGIPFQQGALHASTRGNEVFFGVQQKKNMAYFITTPDCASLQRLELGSKRKRLVTEVLSGDDSATPDSIRIQHHTFTMRISLTKLEKE